MYYLYKNTQEESKIIGRYQNQDEATARIEYLAINNLDENATGYAVRDQDFTTLTEWDI